jgi:glucose-6-phosphate isomerase
MDHCGKEGETMSIKLDLTPAGQPDLSGYQALVTQIHEKIKTKKGLGSDFLGWSTWPFDYDEAEFNKVKRLAKTIQEKAEVLVVCGIGGSYLGTRAALEMIQGLYPSRKLEIVFLGNTFSSTYIVQALDHIKDKSVYVNVISKSGTTTETAMAFRMLKQFLEHKYGKAEAKNRIIATTDKAKGTLKTFADKEGYETLTIPDDIGGRYSVLTSVGLLPIAAAGIDIDAMMEGAKAAALDCANDDLEVNTAYQYAVMRRLLEKEGKSVELLVSYESQMAMVAEWWKQLFGESEGKENKGLFPASVNFSTDLHSMGQFVQEGKKILFETLLMVNKPLLNAVFPEDADNLDSMNYLAGKTLNDVNKAAMKGTLIAHHDEAGIPNMILTIDDFSAKSFGYMAQWFFIACGMSVYLLGVNPFNQPGVEVYKKNMFKLLGKI